MYCTTVYIVLHTIEFIFKLYTSVNNGKFVLVPVCDACTYINHSFFIEKANFYLYE